MDHRKSYTSSPENFKQQLTEENHSISRLRIVKNLLVICFGFFFLYLPFQSLQNLQSTLNSENNIGIMSQTIIYVSVILSALLLPKLIIKKFGCKMAIVLCILTFVPYFVANFYPHVGAFVPTAVLLGTGAGPLWSAKCTYTNEISVLYANYSTDSVDVITSKFFGIFFMIFQNTQIWGNIISFVVLKPSKSKAAEDYPFSYYNTTDVNIVKTWSEHGNLSCGAGYCGGINENLMPPSESKRIILISMYLFSVLLSALTVFLFLDPLKQQNNSPEKDDGVFSRATATLKHLRNTNQLLLVPLTIFNGIEQAFILDDFSKAYVACAWGLDKISLVFICYGTANATTSFLAGRLVKYIPRLIVMMMGAAGNTSVSVTLLLWQPKVTEFICFFILIGIWGFCDAIWLTQINTLYGVLFKAEEEAAFANFKLWESVGFALAFGCSIFLCIAEKIYILLTFLMLGIVGYITIEIRIHINKKSYSVSKF